MSDNVVLKTFPKNKEAALTMLYLEKQDLTGVTPVELAKMYDEAYTAIDSYFDAIATKKLSDFYK